MAPERYLPSTSLLVGMVESGMTHQQIADKVYADTGVRVSRSSVSAALSKAGHTKRVRYDDHIPWRVKIVHTHHHMLNMLRLEGRKQAGGELTDQEESNLESFKRRLKEQGAVVTYIRDTDEGWFLVKARPIDTGMIRIP